MAISFENSIIPMSELRMNLKKIRAQLKKTPIIITNDGRPDFGVCDLETLAIAAEIRDLKTLLSKRLKHRKLSEPAEAVFARLDKKYEATR